MMSLLEPGMILIMGGIVTTIVLAIMLPVMTGMQDIMNPTKQIRSTVSK